MKFDGKSTLVGFKYEHLLKFCFHCGVICHGVEGCLKRIKLRNHEVNQFGLWLRETSPTRKVARAYDRHVEHYDSSRYPNPSHEEEPKQSSAQGKKDIAQKRKATEHGESNFVGVNFRKNQNGRAKGTRSGNTGQNRGDRDDEIFFESQLEKERNKF